MTMPRAGATGPKKSRAPKAQKLADEFPKGMVLRDLCKQEWQLGEVVGKGGFGLIYLACENNTKGGKNQASEYVIKIEPKESGPLFCEMQFYQRVAKHNSIQTYIKDCRLQYLAIPPFIAMGLCCYKSHEYRFLVMPRYGTDLQKILVDSGGMFPAHTTFAIGLRMLDALEFMHLNEYVHADIKASNILQGFLQGCVQSGKVYLVDFGLAFRYTVDGVHKEYKEDPRKAHDGTIEFTSRDAHKGVAPSRRGDLEILGYCLLQWLCGKLPWENKLSDPAYVAGRKEWYMKHINSLMCACFPGAENPNAAVSDAISKFLEIVSKLKYDTTPNYNQLRDILKCGLTKSGVKDEWTLKFGTSPKEGIKRKSTGDGPEEPKAKKVRSKSPGTSNKKAVKAKTVAPPPRKQQASTVKPKPSKRRTPVSKNACSPKKSPAVNGTKSKVLAKGKSPRSPAIKVKSSEHRKNVASPRSLPPPTKGESSAGKPVLSRSAIATASKASIRRRVKRLNVVKSDVSVQTSPGLQVGAPRK